METAEARLAFMTGLRRPLSKADRKEKYTPGCVPQPSSIKTRMKHYRSKSEEAGETTFCSSGTKFQRSGVSWFFGSMITIDRLAVEDKPSMGERNLNIVKKGCYNIVSSSPQTIDKV